MATSPAEIRPCPFDGCDALGARAWSAVSGGVDFDGSAALFAIERWECASGHWWTGMGEVVRDPFADPGPSPASPA